MTLPTEQEYQHHSFQGFGLHGLIFFTANSEHTQFGHPSLQYRKQCQIVSKKHILQRESLLTVPKFILRSLHKLGPKVQPTPITSTTTQLKDYSELPQLVQFPLYQICILAEQLTRRLLKTVNCMFYLKMKIL